MRIGQWVIYRDKYRATEIQERVIEQAFRVGEETPWFRAVLAIIEQCEKRQLEDTRGYANTANEKGCFSSAGALMMADIIRIKIKLARAEAVKGKE